MTKLLLVLIGLLGLAAYVLPGRLEVTPSPCPALDARAARLLGMSKMPQGARPADLGKIIGEVVQRNVPFLPPEIACAAAYWLSVYQPDLNRLAAGLAAPRE